MTKSPDYLLGFLDFFSIGFGFTFSNARRASLKPRGLRETGFSFVTFFFSLSIIQLYHIWI
jgi:hypothetical protein